MKRIVTVSDHALVRWLERAHGIDLGPFRAAIASVVREAFEAGASGVKKDGLFYALAEDGSGVVVTVTPYGGKRMRRLPIAEAAE